MRVAIVGAGPGSGDLTHDGERAIAQAGLVIGSARLVAALAQPGQATVVAARPDDVVAAIESARPHDLVAAVESPHPEHLLAAIESARPEHLLAAIEAARPDGVVTAIESAGATDVAVLMSGDVGFHSGASKVAALLRGSRVDAEVRLIPGVSSVAALAARVGVPWEDACLVSCHGGVTDLVSPVRRHRTTIALTGGNLPTLAAALREAGYGGLHVWAGEDLGLPGETVTRTTVDGLAGRAWSSLTTILVDNPDFDSRVLSGLPDDRFVRGRVPLTKSAVRAVALARLAVRPTDTCFDVGCGTGSVTVELALAAHCGQVFGVDKNPEAIALTRQNCRAFHIGNAHVAAGLAPDALDAWPTPDVAFVGGTSGSMRAIVAAVVRRNPSVRLAITAIAVESAAAALDAVAAVGLTPRVTQIAVADGRPVGGLHLLTAHNPVTLVTGGRDG